MTAKRFRFIATMIITLIFLLAWVFPIVWSVLNSLKTDQDVLAYPPKLIFQPTLEAYRDVLFGSGSILPNLISSFVISIGTTDHYHADGGAGRLCAGALALSRQEIRRLLCARYPDAAAGRHHHSLFPDSAKHRLDRHLSGHHPDLSVVLAAVRDLAAGVLFRGHSL